MTDVICEKCGRNIVIRIGSSANSLRARVSRVRNLRPSSRTPALRAVCSAKVVKKKSAPRLCVLLVASTPVETCQFATWDKPLQTKCELRFLAVPSQPRFKEGTDVCLREGCGYKELVKEGLPPEETEKRRKMREARAAKAAERAAAKEAAEKNGETGRKRPAWR